MAGGSNGYQADLVSRPLTPGLISSSPGTAGLPPFIFFSTSYPKLDSAALLGFSLTARAELEKDRIVVGEVYPFITATDFGKNRMGKPSGGERGRENFLDE